MDKKIILAQALVRASDLSLNGKHGNDGICALVFDYIHAHNAREWRRGLRGFAAVRVPVMWVESWLFSNAAKWPGYSGSPLFPVPAPDDWVMPLAAWGGTREAAIFCDYKFPKWEGEYGRSRRLLLAFLLEQIAKEL